MPPLIAGNLRQQSIDEIWQNRTMTYWRSLTPRDCIGCNAFSQCHGGCYAQALLNHKEQDPLITQPITAPITTMEGTIRLYAGLYPIGLFLHRQERDFETLIGKRGQVVFVPPGCEELSSRLNGSLTLLQVKQRYGQTALDWAGHLAQKGLVEWGSNL